jgi:hypothetical protein
MKKALICVASLFFTLSLFAQMSFDSAVFNNKTIFKNGIYTCLQEIKYNTPRYPDGELELEKSQSRIDLNTLYFRNSVNTRLKFDADLFATVVDGHLSIFYDNQLNSVFLKGAISTFILNEIVTTTSYMPRNNMGYGSPGYGYPGSNVSGNGSNVAVTTSHEETNIYCLDFVTGIILKVNKENLEPIIMRDCTLYTSFEKIGSDANNKKSYPFISQYNTRNPVYIKMLPDLPNTDE